MDTGHDPRTAALAVLGLPAGATRNEVAAAYRRAVLATHPDRCADPDTRERFATVLAAYRQAIQEPRAPGPAPRPTGGTTQPRFGSQPAAPLVVAPVVVGPVHYTPYQPTAPRRRG